MKLIPILMLSILLGAVVITPRQANATIVIGPGPFGVGIDCFLVGNWDLATFTCTLTTDVTESVEIVADGIILDCDGHSITGSNSGNGIDLTGRTAVSIKNCIVTDFFDGIHLDNSDGNTLIDNTVTGNPTNIQLDSSNDNTLKRNTVSGGLEGIGLDSSNDNTLRDNTATGVNGDGIDLSESDGNTLKGNRAIGNSLGIALNTSTGNALSGNTANQNGLHGILITTRFH